MTLQRKLTILTSLSIIIICFLGINIIIDSYDDYKRMTNIEKVVTVTDDLSKIIHEIQKERGIASAYLISGAEVFQKRLIKQRELTDLTIKNFENKFSNNLQQLNTELKKRIKNILLNYNQNIESKRQNILNKSITSFDVIDFYTSINDELINAILISFKISNNPEITNDLMILHNLLLIKDKTGLQRATGSIILEGDTSTKSLDKFKEVSNALSMYKKSFSFYASIKAGNPFNDNLKSPKLKKVDLLISKLENWDSKDSLNIQSVVWFDSLSRKIDFHNQENLRFLKVFQEDVKSYKDKSKSQLIFLSIIMLFSILVFIVFTYSIQKSVLKSLSDFRTGLLSFFDYLNQKTNNIQMLNENTNDEFSLMSKTVNQSIETTKKSLDEDKEILKEAVLIIKEFHKGNLHQRLNVQVSNPALNELKSILNQMANNLEITIEELQHTNDEYEVSLENLKNTQSQLIESEKMASLGGLVAGVAHEINTPIGIGITGSSHFLEMTNKLKTLYDNDKMSEDEFEEYLTSSLDLAKLINVNLSKAAKLVKSFKQIAVDQTSEEKRTFLLDGYLKELLLSISNILKKTNLSIDITCDSNLKVFTYPGLLSQVITNLIINSTIHAYEKEQEGTITIDVQEINNTLKFIYKDDGKGISSENLNKIFDPFFTTNREHGGSGLGLNIIYNIITKQLNGTIKCNSEESVGTEFIIIFKI